MSGARVRILHLKQLLHVREMVGLLRNMREGRNEAQRYWYTLCVRMCAQCLYMYN